MSTTDLFFSSDSVRTAQPLRYAQSVELPGPLRLEKGGELPAVTVVYETYGKLNAAGDNAVLVCHALSGDSHVARHTPDDDPGWWDIVVGPGKVIDTDRYFVICPNLLGGCRGTTGPGSINPATGRPYGQDFPTITIGDMVTVQRMLLDKLGIRQLRAVIGGSMGGHVAMTWAIRHPDRVRGCIAVATSARLTSQALAFDVVGRNAILRDPWFHGGQYYDKPTKPEVGLALARMIGHITYLSREAMQEKFEANRYQPREVPVEFEKKFSVGSYLGYQGKRFVERFDANSYITLTMAMDLFDLGGTVEELTATLRPARCRWLVISFSSDWLFPPEQSQDIVEALVTNDIPVSYCNVTSRCGHDAFLLEDDLDRYGALIRDFLHHLDPDTAQPVRADLHGPKSIFHQQRIDYDHILNLIPPQASVLDLGCGRGSLLARLRARGHRRLVGVDIDEQAIVAAVGRGLDVVQADLNHGLRFFRDGQFDYVVLSLTLQAILDVEGVMREMLRVGRQGIVSFPNFGYHKIRRMVAEEGRSPKTAGQLHYDWWNTPNRRFFSILDFEEFCRDRQIRISRQIYLDTESGVEVTTDPNRNADLAIFVLSR
ncbi:MAG: homoserine O-acetyltransferase [Verrucomicrobiae bacterium]|nr:homoserine O-acetyltransferase [Verrucomicrobiae bacterium]